MTSRGYTLLNISANNRLWPDHDLTVRLLEYLRQNLPSIIEGLPDQSELDLLADQTAHNPFPTPTLDVHVPWGIEHLPPPLDMSEQIDAWLARHSDAELRTLALSTPAPTWNELQSMRVYPPR